MRKALARLAGLLRLTVVVWIGALVLAAFLPTVSSQRQPVAEGGTPDPCGLTSEERIALVKEHKSSEDASKALKAKCESGGQDVSADQPAGENWLMRRMDALKEEAGRPSYKRMRELFIAAEVQQSLQARLAALRKVLELADSPLLRHRAHIEIAHTALRSGAADVLKLAEEAAKAAHKEAQFLPKSARADAFLVEAELALRAGRMRQSLDLLDRALEHDSAYLAAHLLRLDIIVRLSPKLTEAEKANFVDRGIASASFVRLLTARSYVVDARSAIAEQYEQSDVAALLTFYLGSLADDRESTKQAIAAFLAQCGSGMTCSAYVRELAQQLMDGL